MLSKNVLLVDFVTRTDLKDGTELDLLLCPFQGHTKNIRDDRIQRRSLARTSRNAGFRLVCPVFFLSVNQNVITAFVGSNSLPSSSIQQHKKWVGMWWSERHDFS